VSKTLGKGEEDVVVWVGLRGWNMQRDILGLMDATLTQRASGVVVMVEA
jgi:hypothetical protein